MDTTLLQSLDGRWPRDEVRTKSQPSISDAISMLATAQNVSLYRDHLVLDAADSQALASFAAAMRLTYAAYDTTQSLPRTMHPPAWLGVRVPSTVPLYAHVMTGKLMGYPVTMSLEYAPANAQADKPSDPQGYEPIQIHKRSIIRVALPKVFPQMLLDSNANDHGVSSSIPSSVARDQLVTLEGQFSSHYDFFAPKGLQVSALTVLAPNFMQLLIDSSSSFDVEFYGNELVLVTRDPLFTPTVMAQAVRVLQEQLTYLDRLLVSWNYQPQTPPFDLLRYDFVGGSVTKIGKYRLRPAALLAIVLFIMFVFIPTLIVISDMTGN